MVSGLSNVLWLGYEPSNSFSGASDYAQLAVSSWTSQYPYWPEKWLGVMNENRMGVEPCFPLFSAELELAEALASSQQKKIPYIWQTVML